MSELPSKAKQGLQAFNQGNFYAAHEYFEATWRETPGDTREFYRALLHLSAGYYRLTQDRPDAALKFFQRSHHWMGQFSQPVGQIDTNDLITHFVNLITHIQSGLPTAVIFKEYNFQIYFLHQESG
jgi:predicted metal-dependent hydrolase